MKYVFLVALCSAPLNSYAELSPLDDMSKYSISSKGDLQTQDGILPVVDNTETMGVAKFETKAASLDLVSPSVQSNILVRDTGHTMTLEPILIQIGGSSF